MRRRSAHVSVKHGLAIFAIPIALTIGAATGLAEGNVKRGEDLFNERCQACHTVDEGGADKVGPNLFGLFGATAGQRAFSFERRHSTAMRESGVVWSEENLDRFLENPKNFLPGTRMPFVGFREKTDRENVIAYLKSATR